MPQKLFFSGNNLQQALLAAARHLQLEPEEVAYRPRERRQGVVKGSGKVVIEVDPEAPRRAVGGPAASAAPSHGAAATSSSPLPGTAAASPAPPPPRAVAAPIERPPRAVEAPIAPRPERSAAGREPAGPPAAGPGADAAREALQELLALGGLDLEVAIYQGAERLEIELTGPDADLVVAQNGELLLGLEHLLSRALRAELGESVACRLDAGGFRREHEARLEGMARAAAEEVRRSGEPKRLPRMNPADRRLIHVTLAEEPGVTTASDGEGYLKTVVVHPA
jgi:spoIIIJ-associated protein